MDFWFTEEQDAWRHAVRALVERSSPISATRARMEHGEPFGVDTWRAGIEQGWLELLEPTGDHLVEITVVAEELGRVAYDGPLLANALAARALTGDDRHTQLRSGITGGARTAAVCLRDRLGAVGTDGVETVATRLGGGFRIDGRKQMVPNAMTADVLVVLACLEDAPALFVVPRDVSGITVEPTATIDITRRFDGVRFDGVEVGADAFVGTEGDAASTVDALEDLGALLVTADAVGSAAALLDLTVAYTKDRYAFDLPIGSYQAVKHKCADLLLWLECGRIATYAAAVTLRDEPEGGRRMVSIAKSYVGDVMPRFAMESLQVFGGIGYTWEHDLHLYLRRLTAAPQLFGDVAWHRERLATIGGCCP